MQGDGLAGSGNCYIKDLGPTDRDTALMSLINEVRADPGSILTDVDAILISIRARGDNTRVV